MYRLVDQSHKMSNLLINYKKKIKIFLSINIVFIFNVVASIKIDVVFYKIFFRIRCGKNIQNKLLICLKRFRGLGIDYDRKKSNYFPFLVMKRIINLLIFFFLDE